MTLLMHLQVVETRIQLITRLGELEVHERSDIAFVVESLVVSSEPSVFLFFSVILLNDFERISGIGINCNMKLWL